MNTWSEMEEMSEDEVRGERERERLRWRSVQESGGSIGPFPLLELSLSLTFFSACLGSHSL